MKNSNWKESIGKPINLGDCKTCFFNDKCKFKDDRDNIINNIPNIIQERETPLNFEISCREYLNKMLYGYLR